MNDDQQSDDAPSAVTTIPLGAATLTVVNVGDSLWTLAEELGLREAERAAHPDLFASSLFAGQCVHITLPDASVLVDASVYDYPLDSPQVPPGYVPPPDLLTALAAHGIAADGVRHVVITHPHFDHINGLTRPDDEHPDQWRPCFANARHYLGARDWESPEMRAALADPDSLEARTLGVLYAAGLLELLAGASEREIVPGVRIVPAPGETPGHQVVRVESVGRVAYCLGDLFHSAEEVARPEWMAVWADRAAMAASRRALLAAALAEDALLVAAHISGAGRLVAEGTGVRWQTAG
ncbi:MAG TPA: MBL fold metallo-hydrolase [Ktedonobacterales bacterium]